MIKVHGLRAQRRDYFMIPSLQLNINGFRLLDVDNRCVLPFDFNIRVLTSSMDVIHA